MATLDVTTIDRLKRQPLTGILANDDQHDETLSGLIAEVSGELEQLIGTPLLSESVTEYHDVQFHQDAIWLARSNVTAIASIKNRRSISTEWADVTALDSSTYDFSSSGRVVFNLSNFAPGPRSLQVVYTGGLAASTAALLASYPALVSAAERQIAYVFKRRNSPGKTATRVGGQSESTEDEVRLLKSVVEAWTPYRRYAM